MTAETKTTKAANPAPKKAKLVSNVCRWGEGAYGSPATAKRCGAVKEHASRQLCDKHEALWKIEARKRHAAKVGLPAPAAKKPAAKVVPIRAAKPKPEKMAAFVAPTEAKVE